MSRNPDPKSGASPNERITEFDGKLANLNTDLVKLRDQNNALMSKIDELATKSGLSKDEILEKLSGGNSDTDKNISTLAKMTIDLKATSYLAKANTAWTNRKEMEVKMSQDDFQQLAIIATLYILGFSQVNKKGVNLDGFLASAKKAFK